MIIPEVKFAAIRKSSTRALQASLDAKRLSDEVFELLSKDAPAYAITPDLPVDEWQRGNIDRQARTASGFRKKMSEIFGVVEVAKIYFEVRERDPLWAYEHRTDELAKTLASISIKLKIAAEEMN